MIAELAGLALCLILLQRLMSRRRTWGPIDWVTPGRFRWLLVCLYALLCINNLVRLPYLVGYDARAHFSYIDFLVKECRLPLATDGWQMFQSPLFYLLAAVPYAFLKWTFSQDAARSLIRIIPMMSGLGLIELSFRTARTVFPNRPRLQYLATVVGGFLPANLYMAQFIGNEPLAGFLSALSIYLGVRLICRESEAAPKREVLILGAVLGLAILTKVTAVLLVAPIFGLVLWVTRKSGRGWRAGTSRAALFLGSCTAVCGWYFLRNWYYLGNPFIGGWAPRPEMAWWGDPGVRVAADFTHFGQVLVRPIYASAYGFWNGLYSTLWLDGFVGSLPPGPVQIPFWSGDLLVGAALLALPLATFLVLGILRTPWGDASPEENGLVFLAICAGFYLAAMLLMFLRVPFYGAVKATYGLALAPTFGVFAARGAAGLLEMENLRLLIWVYLFCWTGVVWLTYFAV